MNKFWIVFSTGIDSRSGYMRHSTYEAAEEEMKRQVDSHKDSRYWILESIATAISPVPDVPVFKM